MKPNDWEKDWENEYESMLVEIENDPTIGDGGTHSELDVDKVKEFIRKSIAQALAQRDDALKEKIEAMMEEEWVEDFEKHKLHNVAAKLRNEARKQMLSHLQQKEGKDA